MTEDQIIKINALVAEHIMGCTVRLRRFGEAVGIVGGRVISAECTCRAHEHVDASDQSFDNIKDYVSDWRAVGEVVEAMRRDEYQVVLRGIDQNHTPVWVAGFLDEKGILHEVIAETLPLSVCFAALKAKGVAY